MSGVDGFMANFNTHLSVALAVSTSLATAGMMMGAYGFGEMVALSLVGMVGGLLPDIDLDNSRIARLVFTTISLFGTSFALFIYHQYHQLALMDALVAWGLGFLVIRFGVLSLFSRLTRHRGMVHSVPYMAVLSLMLIYVAFYILKLSGALSWLVGGFLYLGALVHLLLDELFSVNIYGLKVKKSFGSALKCFEAKRPIAYALLYALLFALLIAVPPWDNVDKLLYRLLSQL